MVDHVALRGVAATAVALLLYVSPAIGGGWEAETASWTESESANHADAVRPASMTTRPRRPSAGTAARSPARVARVSARQSDVEVIGPGVTDDLDWMITDGPAYGQPIMSGPTGYPGAMPPWQPGVGIPPLWVRAEYLLWWTKGMDVPPLITTSPAGVLPTSAGVLGQDRTEILLGDEPLLTGARSGGRIRFGTWLNTPRSIGLQGEYFALFNRSESHTFSSNATGSPILARPFFNLNPRNVNTGAFDPPAREDSELIAYPNLIRGTATVDASSTLQSAAGMFVWNACSTCYDCCDPCQDPCQGFCRHNMWLEQDRVDWLAGYRYAVLREDLRITEDLTSLETGSPAGFQIYDRFDTRNEFHGGEVGVVHMIQRDRWMLEGALKLAIGNTRQSVTIDGGTRFTAPGALLDQDFAGGLLAQRTNMGTYSRNVFSMLPQVGVTAGYRITPRLAATVGYTLVYWSRVARPGDQIDLYLNPDLLPPEADPFTGPLRPQFAFADTDYWAHGFSAGLDYRW